MTGAPTEAPLFAAQGRGAGAVVKATGTVEIEWPKGVKQDIPEEEWKLAYVDIDAFPPNGDQSAFGTFTYRVLNRDSTPHREIVAALSGVIIDTETDPTRPRAYYVGTVVSDERICSGGCGGHDGGGDGGGCSDGGTHDDGGCSGGGSDGGMGSSDGGMGGSDGGMGGGCSDGGTDGGCTDGGTDGGCTDGGTDGGCTDGGSHDEGGCSGGGGSGGGGSVPGQGSRVGQIVVGKLHDGGMPGAGLDGITWKWFAADNPNLPSIDDTSAWPHLCKKTIIGGNLTVHGGQ